MTSSLRDLCPDCLDHVTAPTVTDPDPSGRGVVASYVCPDCGHGWTCGWAADTTTDGATAGEGAA